MARPLKGSIKQDGDVWRASVPKRRGSKQLVAATFNTEAEAQTWVDAQINRLKNNRDAELPPAEGRLRRTCVLAFPPAAGPPPEGEWVPIMDVVTPWHAERYDDMHNADQDRTNRVLADVKNHLEPAFPYLPLDTAAAAIFRADVKDWLRVYAGYEAQTPGSRFKVGGRTYSQRVVGAWLNHLRMLLLFLYEHGVDMPVVVEEKRTLPGWIGASIRAMKPVGFKQRTPRLVTMSQTAAIASQLHVVHQLVLWILRLAGLRISEAYGLTVGNFLEDSEGHGYLLIKEQAGTGYVTRGPDEQPQRSNRKDEPKTPSGLRLVALPDSLSELVRTVIAAYHTAEDGSLNLETALIPNIRAVDGGQPGFRSALTKAATSLGLGDVGEDDLVVPHDLRKDFCTDLAHAPGLSDVLRRRAAGHRFGDDVFNAVYVKDRKRFDDMRPAAEAIEQELEREGVHLKVQTARRPLYGRNIPRESVAAADAVLEAAGWQLPALDEGWIDTEEAAAILGRTPQAMRRMFPDLIPAVHDGKGWRVRRDDVLAWRERHAGRTLLIDLVEELADDYHRVYQTVRRLQIEPPKDSHSRQLVLTDADADAVRAEYERLRELRARSVTVREAARVLRASHSSINTWARSGRLTYDAGKDGGGSRYITKASLEAELSRRNSGQRTVISAEELEEYAGLDSAALHALVAAGLLVRERRRGFTVASVRKWACGYRPDLLATGLLPVELVSAES